MSSAATIVKADGTRQPFDEERLAASLRRSGAGEQTAKRIAETIAGSIAPGISSRELYSRAFAMLRKSEARPIAARYALRRALLEFGPTGHPFEDFVSHLFRAQGWEVETRKLIHGKCVIHEVDFYATHPGKEEYLAAELKYHNDPGYKTDLKVALYVKSRFDDIFACDPSARTCAIDRGLLVTNTKFTTEAIAYAQCAGVELLGWAYPSTGNLFDLMTQAKVYPVTTLTSLSRSEKRLLVDSRIVTVGQIASEREALDGLRLPAERVGEVRAEAEGLLSGQ